MNLWILMAALCLAALVFGGYPVYRQSRGLTPLLAGIIVFTIAFSGSLYYFIGSPQVPSGAGTMPEIGAMVTSLADRLEKNPDDLQGWKMLGRSYTVMQRFDDAVTAYERAMAIEGGQNAQTLVELAQALMERNGGATSARAGALLESALALDPNNPNALFYGGIVAANRGDTDLAADRWEILSGLNTPPEIQETLRQKIAEWRGAPLQPVARAAEQSASVVRVNLSMSDAAVRASIPGDATVYVIARDPQQPGPPIAVARQRLSELPMVIELGDRDAMIPGRPLSGFSQFELLARVSVSGDPIAQPGDWFGTLLFRSSGGEVVDLVIDQQTP